MCSCFKDLGIQVPRKEIIDNLIKSLEEKGFALTLEGSFAKYLGIKYEQINKDTISMTQTGLIQKIIDSAGMSECNSNKTPATRECLGSDPEGKPMDDSWNYQSSLFVHKLKARYFVRCESSSPI